METPYSRAWKKFRSSSKYHQISTQLPSETAVGGERFIENRFREAFDAGWNAKTSHILDALNLVARKDPK